MLWMAQASRLPELCRGGPDNVGDFCFHNYSAEELYRNCSEIVACEVFFYAQSIGILNRCFGLVLQHELMRGSLTLVYFLFMVAFLYPL